MNDRYGRNLVSVWLDGHTMLNEVMAPTKPAVCGSLRGVRDLPFQLTVTLASTSTLRTHRTRQLQQPLQQRTT